MVIASILLALIGIFKAISDITSTEDEWRLSIFSRFKETGFFGSKVLTWERKYSFPTPFPRESAFDVYIKRTLYAVLSDIWHVSNALRSVSYILLLIIIPSEIYWWIPIMLWQVRSFTFHIFYHYILRRNDSK